MTRRVQSESRQVSRGSAELGEDHAVQTDSAPSLQAGREMEDNTFYGFMFLPMLTGGTIEEYHKGFLHC